PDCSATSSLASATEAERPVPAQMATEAAVVIIEVGVGARSVAQGLAGGARIAGLAHRAGAGAGDARPAAEALCIAASTVVGVVAEVLAAIAAPIGRARGTPDPADLVASLFGEPERAAEIVGDVSGLAVRGRNRELGDRSVRRPDATDLVG